MANDDCLDELLNYITLISYSDGTYQPRVNNNPSFNLQFNRHEIVTESDFQIHVLDPLRYQIQQFNEIRTQHCDPNVISGGGTNQKVSEFYLEKTIWFKPTREPLHVPPNEPQNVSQYLYFTEDEREQMRSRL